MGKKEVTIGVREAFSIKKPAADLGMLSVALEHFEFACLRNRLNGVA
jgi:hypothetical protein